MFFCCLMPSSQGMAYHSLRLAPMLQQFGAWTVSKVRVRLVAITEKPLRPVHGMK
jgi:hypothetical protein